MGLSRSAACRFTCDQGSMYKETTSVRVFIVEDNPHYAGFLHYVCSLNPSLKVHNFFSASHLLRAFCKENKLPMPQLSKDARQKLPHYHHPGNVRELKSLIELAECEQKEAEHIQYSIHKEEQFLQEELSLKEYSLRIIQHFLKKYNNNVLLVARKLQIGKSSIYRYLKDVEKENSRNFHY